MRKKKDEERCMNVFDLTTLVLVVREAGKIEAMRLDVIGWIRIVEFNMLVLWLHGEE